jgi:hypothetical protein
MLPLWRTAANSVGDCGAHEAQRRAGARYKGMVFACLPASNSGATSLPVLHTQTAGRFEEGHTRPACPQRSDSGQENLLKMGVG